MTHQVLARKWRPQNFAELVGQAPVLSALIHSLNAQKLHHAYLFTGTRGVGKTTVARIIAKCMNCEQGISATPCGTCSTCLDIPDGRFVDLIEIDAASRTKVEDTREILDNIQYSPSKGRFKVYLIDEVHMLSTHSFNALLKTLEEPPAHVKFLLATTDPQKLPMTVLSRCLQFHLKHIPQDLIVERLGFILDAEKISFEPAALPLIAKAAEGSLRDALSLLDQAISQGEGEVVTRETAHMLGVTEPQTLYRLAQALASQDGKTLYQCLQALENQPINYKALLGLFTELCYEISLEHTLPNSPHLNWDTPEIVRLAQCLSPTLTQLFYQMSLQGRKDLDFAPAPHIGFNMTLLRMLAFQPLEIEAPTAQPTPVTPPRATVPPPLKAPSRAPAEASPSVASAPEAPAAPLPASWPAEGFNTSHWENLISTLVLGGMLKQLVRHMRFDHAKDKILHLSLEKEHQSLLNQKLQDRLQEALLNHYGEPIVLQISVSDTPLNTPAAQQQKALELSQKQLQDKLAQDPHLDFIKNNFNAKIADVKLT